MAATGEHPASPAGTVCRGFLVRQETPAGRKRQTNGHRLFRLGTCKHSYSVGEHYPAAMQATLLGVTGLYAMLLLNIVGHCWEALHTIGRLLLYGSEHPGIAGQQ